MGGARDFRELVAWQLARQLKTRADDVEVLNHFIDGVDRAYISKEEFPSLEHTARQALKAAIGLIRHLESTPDPPQR